MILAADDDAIFETAGNEELTCLEKSQVPGS